MYRMCSFFWYIIWRKRIKIKATDAAVSMRAKCLKIIPWKKKIVGTENYQCPVLGHCGIIDRDAPPGDIVSGGDQIAKIVN